MQVILIIGVVFLWIFGVTKFTYAIPPPDFIIQAGSQLVQIFSILLLTFSAGFSLFWRKIVFLFRNLKYKKTVSFFSLLLCIVIIFAISYFLNNLNKVKNENRFKADVLSSISDKINGYDVSGIKYNNSITDNTLDFKEEFIRGYYLDISNGNLDDAYSVSKQSVDFNTFSDWYYDIDKIEVNGIYPLMVNKYSVFLSLYENNSVTEYSIIMTLDDSNSLKIKDSVVNVVSVNENYDTDIKSCNGLESDENGFSNIIISNEEFENIDTDKVYIVDAREDEEYDLGYYEGSVHIRFADLLNGDWKLLSNKDEVIIICWSAIRGSETAKFLRKKSINARYLEDGAIGWVEYGGDWIGDILFSSQYFEDRYVNVLDTEYVRNAVASGVILVDSRDKNTYDNGHIDVAINISAFFTSTDELEDQLNSIKYGSSIITICDDYLSCFDAKIIGIKLEKKGVIFLGRYNKPYEY